MDDTTNLTEQESDDLLRAEIFAQEDSNSDSGTNESQEQVEEATEEVETEEAETTEEESQEAEQAEEKPKKKSNVPKILAEKNEWKRKAMEANERIAELEGNLWTDVKSDKEYFENVVKSQISKEMETLTFFTANPQAYEMKGDLDLLIEENPKLSYERAYKHYLAETNPQALLDEQTKNKLNSKVYSSSWRAPSNARNTKVEYTYDDNEFDKLIKEWKIRL
jgi:hypothetical protein